MSAKKPHTMRQKSVDAAVGVFFVFGWRRDGTVDVSDGQRDVFEGLPGDVAEAVCKAQAEFRRKLYDLLATERHPEDPDKRGDET